MGNRFATLTQYHSLVTAHGVLAAITFLFLVPAAVLIKRFHRARYHETNLRTHAYLNVLAVGFSTVVFILGFFAVGPSRALSNPHHGIGVAIYVLILLQAFGGRMIRNVRGHSFRAHCHRWMGRTIGLLGVVQIPLGLTLYGSPKYTFVLYALWMTFLLLVYFVLSYTREGDRAYASEREGGRSEKRKSSGGMGWLMPVAAGAAALALLRGGGKKKKDERARSVSRSRSRSRSRARSASRMRSRSRGHEAIASRRGSDSYVDEKYERRKSEGGGGFMSKALGVGAALGAGALFSRMLGRKERSRHDEEYSAVATDTPSRSNRIRRHRPPPSEYSDDYTVRSGHGGRGGSILPPPNPTAAAAALSAAEMRPGVVGGRPPPTTPQRSHPGRSAVESGLDASDYSSYVSPSRRADERRKSGGGVGKGLLAGLGLGWFANKLRGRRGEYREEDRLRAEEDDRRAGYHGSRFTGDGYPSPTRSHSRRHRPGRPMPAPSGVTSVSDESSMIEPRPVSGYGGPPMAPVPPSAPPPPGYAPVTPVPLRASRSGSRTRHEMGSSAAMPPMPPDTYHESGSESYFSSGGQPARRHSSRRRREGEAAAAAAAATAGRLAAEEDHRHHRGGGSSSGQPVSVKVKVHDDPDRNITLRRVPAEERRHESGGSSRRPRSDSVSTLSAEETPSNRRYRRESSRGRAELAAERRVENDDDHDDDDDGPLAPPNPAFAAGRRPKDSAYYSGQPGPSGSTPAAGATVSSLGSPGSHGTWSALSPSPSGPLKDPTASAADRRRRRRLERRDGSRQPSGTVEFS